MDASEISPLLFESFLDSNECPDPDIIIRTSGEIRLSDFMLWQAMASCVYFCGVLWPDFTILHLILSIIYYQQNFDTIQRRRKIVQNAKQNFRNSSTSTRKLKSRSDYQINFRQ